MESMPAHRHGAAADREVVRGQLAAAHEVALGRRRPALRPQPLAEAELGARLLIGLRRQRLVATHLLVAQGRRPRRAPTPAARRGAAPPTRPVMCLKVSVPKATSLGRTMRPRSSIQKMVGTLTTL